ncbi:ASCH domain-containing protein [Arcanobacterium phocae]|uniref:ASCH domain-containing protein n=1 Tax=Arcanobacterium phocae TaxID=131112 RepID=UPI001C0EDA75|nr:ASCH domain-containing protein [Arcanobacterium phocae]
MLCESTRALVTHALADHARSSVPNSSSVSDHGDNSPAPLSFIATVQTRSGRVIAGLSENDFRQLRAKNIFADDDPAVAVVLLHALTGRIVCPPKLWRELWCAYDPAITCVMRDDAGLHEVLASQLPECEFTALAPQQINMWEGYETLVMSGQKKQTIRLDDPFVVGPAQIVFDKDSGRVIVDAVVTAVRTCKLPELTEEDARRDGFASLAELYSALHRHYPQLPADPPVDVVTFELAK